MKAGAGETTSGKQQFLFSFFSLFYCACTIPTDNLPTTPSIPLGV